MICVSLPGKSNPSRQTLIKYSTTQLLNYSITQLLNYFLIKYSPAGWIVWVCWESRVHQDGLLSWWDSLASRSRAAPSPPARRDGLWFASGSPMDSRCPPSPPQLGIGDQLSWAKEGEGEPSHFIFNLISFSCLLLSSVFSLSDRPLLHSVINSELSNVIILLLLFNLISPSLCSVKAKFWANDNMLASQKCPNFFGNLIGKEELQRVIFN